MIRKTYDIKLTNSQPLKPAERKREAGTRKTNWEQAMREAAEAEQLAQSGD